MDQTEQDENIKSNSQKREVSILHYELEIRDKELEIDFIALSAPHPASQKYHCATQRL